MNTGYPPPPPLKPTRVIRVRRPSAPALTFTAIGWQVGHSGDLSIVDNAEGVVFTFANGEWAHVSFD